MKRGRAAAKQVADEIYEHVGTRVFRAADIVDLFKPYYNPGVLARQGDLKYKLQRVQHGSKRTREGQKISDEQRGLNQKVHDYLARHVGPECNGSEIGYRFERVGRGMYRMVKL